MFFYELITADNISQQVKRLDINKATQESAIPTKLAKSFYIPIVDYLQEKFNNCLKKDTFPNDFKKAVAHSSYQIVCKMEKLNFKPISTLPNLSKIHERLFHDQIYTDFSIFKNFFLYISEPLLISKLFLLMSMQIL